MEATSSVPLAPLALGRPPACLAKGLWHRRHVQRQQGGDDKVGQVERSDHRGVVAGRCTREWGAGLSGGATTLGQWCCMPACLPACLAQRGMHGQVMQEQDAAARRDVPDHPPSSAPSLTAVRGQLC